MTSVSIVIPAYNEETRLPRTLSAVMAFLARGAFRESEILVIDDGSRDRTAAMVEQFRHTHPQVRLLKNPGNRGKGYAVRHGMLQARGEWVLFSDADLSAPIEELTKLIDAATSQDAAVAIGSRALDRSLIGVHQSAFREYSGRAFNLVMRLLTGLPFRDTQCGFKLFSASAAREIFSRQILDGFSFDVENLFIAQKRRLRAIEVPVRWNDVAGTKVATIQGIRSFFDLLRIRWYGLTGRYR